ncbi:cache domain-containing protein [Campylobacter blaseri]|uniref:cache domain-containing protein n=1 Tax=Campylobacter blaseri TaxID=2042961 RepID=UPI0012FFE737|nr:cache domain-containing protein [Campylobacter blaseri]
MAIKKYFDFNSELLLNTIEEERLNVLTVSLILSSNKDIKKCILEKEDNQCSTTLNNYVETLKNIPLYSNILIHVHSKDFKSIARSWNSKLHGDDLSTFRYTLLNTKLNMKPLAGIEVGRCGVFSRGISPVLDKKEFIGSIEVMLDFSHLYKLAKSQGYNLFMIIDKRYSTDCFYSKHNILKNHILLNPEYANLNIAPMLNEINLNDKNLQKIGKNYLYSKPFKDVNNNLIGHIVMHINEDDKERSFSTLHSIFK